MNSYTALGLTPITGVSVPAPASMTIKAYATHLDFVPSLVAIATYGTVTTPTWTSLDFHGPPLS